MTFMLVWIGYTIVGVTIFSAVFVWAVRNHQFTDMDRGRYIALRLDSIDPAEYRRESRADRYALIGLILLSLTIFVTALVVGIRTAYRL